MLNLYRRLYKINIGLVDYMHSCSSSVVKSLFPSPFLMGFNKWTAKSKWQLEWFKFALHYLEIYEKRLFIGLNSLKPDNLAFTIESLRASSTNLKITYLLFITKRCFHWEVIVSHKPKPYQSIFLMLHWTRLNRLLHFVGYARQVSNIGLEPKWHRGIWNLRKLE